MTKKEIKYKQPAKLPVALGDEQPKIGADGLRSHDDHLFVSSHDEMSPLLHRPGGADLSVWDVGRDEAQQALQEDLRAVVNVILLRGQLCKVVLETGSSLFSPVPPSCTQTVDYTHTITD